MDSLSCQCLPRDVFRFLYNRPSFNMVFEHGYVTVMRRKNMRTIRKVIITDFGVGNIALLIMFGDPLVRVSFHITTEERTAGRRGI